MKNFNSGEKQYYIANVEYYDDDSDSFDMELLQKAVRLFNKIAKSITSTQIKSIELNELDKKQPSFQIAMKSGLTLEQKQRLIESKSESYRLELLFTHLKTLNLIVEEADLANTIIKNDGYFSPSDLKI